jgi:transcriptional repressor NrdR
MLCPYCHYPETKVVDSRLTQEGKSVRRRRECEQCRTRFSTYEEPDFYRVTVIKKDGHRRYSIG